MTYVPRCRAFTVSVSTEPCGTLRADQLASSMQLYQHLLTRPEKAVVVLSEPEWTFQEKSFTFREAADRILLAEEPTYTANTHTALFGGARFFIMDGDMMDSLVDVFTTDGTSAFNATEDLLVGSPASYTSPHLDNAPCNPNRVTVLVGTKRVAAWPFRGDVALPDDIPVCHVVSGGDLRHMTEEDWARIEEYALEQGGWVREINAGEYITFPSLWWHAAYNVTGTVSVNITFMTAYDVPKVLFNTVRLGIYRTRRPDIFEYNRPVILGGGLADAFGKAFDIVSSQREEPYEMTDQDAARKGAWLFTASRALAAYQGAHAGVRGKGRGGMRAALSIEGFTWKTVSKWIVKIRRALGDTPNAQGKKRRRGGE